MAKSIIKQWLGVGSDLIQISGQDHGLELGEAPSLLTKLFVYAVVGLRVSMLCAKDKAALASYSNVANFLRTVPALPGVSLHGLRSTRGCLSLTGSKTAGGDHHNIILVFLKVVLFN